MGDARYVAMVHDDDHMKELWNLRQQYHSTSVYGLSKCDQDEENEIESSNSIKTPLNF